MNRVIVIFATLAFLLLEACAANPKAQTTAEGAGESAGEEHPVTHHEREIDPNWDSAEEADEQLEGD